MEYDKRGKGWRNIKSKKIDYFNVRKQLNHVKWTQYTIAGSWNSKGKESGTSHRDRKYLKRVLEKNGSRVRQEELSLKQLLKILSNEQSQAAKILRIPQQKVLAVLRLQIQREDLKINGKHD